MSTVCWTSSIQLLCMERSEKAGRQFPYALFSLRLSVPGIFFSPLFFFFFALSLRKLRLSISFHTGVREERRLQTCSVNRTHGHSIQRVHTHTESNPRLTGPGQNTAALCLLFPASFSFFFLSSLSSSGRLVMCFARDKRGERSSCIREGEKEQGTREEVHSRIKKADRRVSLRSRLFLSSRLESIVNSRGQKSVPCARLLYTFLFQG